MAREKLRIRFRKEGPLRLVSHNDLLRTLERLLRRAALPFARTNGFHPTPCLAFPLSLPLGTIGQAEVMELELTELLPTAQVLAALNMHANPGLVFTSALPIDRKAVAYAHRVEYHCTHPDGDYPADLAVRCTRLLAESAIWLERTRPRWRRFDVRPYVQNVAPTDTGIGQSLWVSRYGAVRAEEVLECLGLSAGRTAGWQITRTVVELTDEVSAHTPPFPEVLTRPAEPTRPPPRRSPTEQPTPAGVWGASPHGPVVE
jgi:radical SAM-linked protein